MMSRSRGRWTCWNRFKCASCCTWFNADAETRCGPFRNEPDLSLPGEKETVTRGKVTLLHRDRDVVGRIHEQVIFTELLQ